MPVSVFSTAPIIVPDAALVIITALLVSPNAPLVSPSAPLSSSSSGYPKFLLVQIPKCPFTRMPLWFAQISKCCSNLNNLQVNPSAFSNQSRCPSNWLMCPSGQLSCPSSWLKYPWSCFRFPCNHLVSLNSFGLGQLKWPWGAFFHFILLCILCTPLYTLDKHQVWLWLTMSVWGKVFANKECSCRVQISARCVQST